MENPFAEGESRAFRLPVTVLVIFGATGGLTHHKLPPALYNLAYDGFLPEHCLILGVSRTKLTDEQFRDRPGTGGRNLRLTPQSLFPYRRIPDKLQIVTKQRD